MSNTISPPPPFFFPPAIWWLQSRRADVIPLWTLLTFMGRSKLGNEIDRTIELAQQFYDLTEEAAGQNERPASLTADLTIF